VKYFDSSALAEEQRSALTKTVRGLVRPERFELPACCFGGLPAQKINNLAGIAWSDNEQYSCGFARIPLFRLSLHVNPSGSVLGTNLGTVF
jgi:hypothetical protein